ncbi:MAG: flagellar export chaperone FlgN [Clostridia bacterium]|nr:flagellar export chaperone FlgN [Clostridia bacterium]
MQRCPNLFSSLKEILVQQNDVTEKLFRLGEKQLNCIRHGDLEALNLTVNEQEQLARELDRLEQQRLKVQRQLEQALDLGRDCSLSQIAAQAGELQSELLELGRILRSSYTKLRDINRLNHLLIKDCLGFLAEATTRLNLNEARMVYTSSGEVAYETKGSIGINELR